MQSLKCEMCGSNDIIKQDGLYVCQHCGTKYSPEDAKKLLIEATIKVDNSQRLNNLYELARRAKEQDDIKNAANYYRTILLDNPNDWEANFYANYFEAATCTIGQISSAADKVNNCLKTVFQMIPEEGMEDYYRMDIHRYTMMLASTLYSASLSHYKEFSDMPGTNVEHVSNLDAIFDMMTTLGDELERYGLTNEAAQAWKGASEMLADSINITSTVGGSDRIYSKDRQNTTKIQKYDSEYKANQGGCYIATAVYGSYDCPEVWVLRRFRDNVLSKVILGKLFIYFYYVISPVLVNTFGNSRLFKVIWIIPLNRLVKYLRNKGFSDRPYNDRL